MKSVFNYFLPIICEAVGWQKATDMSLGTVFRTYSTDIPMLQHGCISAVQMITQLCCVEISAWCSCLLCHIGEVTFSLWYIKII